MSTSNNSNPPPPPPPMSPILLPVNNKGEENATSSSSSVKLCYNPSTPCLQYKDALNQIKEGVEKELELEEGRNCRHALIVVLPLLQPILQCGPVCGLIALVEAGEIMGVHLDPEAVLKDAVDKKMTKSGEMFSAYGMQKLAQNWLPSVPITLLDTSTEDKYEVWKRLVTHLSKKGTALIPYDADYNHGPSLRQGHAAHWAVIHGFVVSVRESEGGRIEIVIVDPSQPESVPVMDRFLKLKIEDGEREAIMESTFIIAHHGKSIRNAIWKYSSLLKSNQNLHQVSPKIVASSEFIFGDIQADLCSKLLLIG